MLQATTKQITEETVASVAVSFDGLNYTMKLLRESMHGNGIRHWQETHQDEIALAKALCYAKHIQHYGFNNQTKPVE